MFDGVVNRHLAERAARRSAYSLGATALESLVISGLVIVTARMAARPRDELPLVEVQFIQNVARPQPPPAAPPPAAARPAAARRSARDAPVVPVSARPRALLALVQPRQVADEMKAPDPNEPIEDYGDGGEAVEGGIIGGIPGYMPDAGVAATAAVARAAEVFEEAPQYATSGFRPPQEAQPGCVRGAVRLPAALTGYVSAPVVVKFAVTRAGTIGTFQVVSPVTDPRIPEVIRQALLSCRWIPGTDAQGRATALWVVMPFRFEAG